MKNWKAPLTKAGKPCKKCQPGRLCPYHRTDGKKRTGNGGPKPKLTREALDTVAELAPNVSSHKPLWEAINVHPATWFRWIDQGKRDAQEGNVSPEREIYESVTAQRRVLAQDLRDAALDAARGHYKVQVKDGKPVRVYKTDPDGRLAANIAGRLDPEALPRDGIEVDHGGEVKVTTRVLAFDKDAYPEPKDD